MDTRRCAKSGKWTISGNFRCFGSERVISDLLVWELLIGDRKAGLDRFGSKMAPPRTGEQESKEDMYET